MSLSMRTIVALAALVIAMLVLIAVLDYDRRSPTANVGHIERAARELEPDGLYVEP
jgi:hypothetical protein